MARTVADTLKVRFACERVASRMIRIEGKMGIKIAVAAQCSFLDAPNNTSGPLLRSLRLLKSNGIRIDASIVKYI